MKTTLMKSIGWHIEGMIDWFQEEFEKGEETVPIEEVLEDWKTFKELIKEWKKSE